MPVRLLKPGLRTSEKFNRCSLLAQSTYVRLLTMVDDYGRYLANPRLLRSELFPLGDNRGEDIPLPQIETALIELKQTGLIIVYESESKSHLQLTTWNEKPRSESKFPAPEKKQLQTIANNCLQMITSPPSPSPSPSDSPSDSPAPAPAPAAADAGTRSRSFSERPDGTGRSGPESPGPHRGAD